MKRLPFVFGLKLLAMAFLMGVSPANAETLILQRIECYDTQDPRYDEVRIVANGRVIWRGTLTKGMAQPIRVQIPFNSYIELHFWEKGGRVEGGPKDDYLGIMVVDDNKRGRGLRMYQISGGSGRKDYNYQVFYEVTR